MPMDVCMRVNVMELSFLSESMTNTFLVFHLLNFLLFLMPSSSELFLIEMGFSLRFLKQLLVIFSENFGRIFFIVILS
uniref:Uncharacterized protein n=1 Tax=Rhizophora mucronata TaxID=61149 RepID=A0A2P2KSS3_RHIMU